MPVLVCGRLVPVLGHPKPYRDDRDAVARPAGRCDTTASVGVPSIRVAVPADAAGCARIYAPYVSDSVISFEASPPGAAEFERRIDAAHVWLVAEDGGELTGYAYGSPHKERAAYAWAADVAIYLADSHRGQGLGRRLYGELFEALRRQGMRRLCAGVTQPNAASDAIHRAMGFQEVGVYTRIGWKHGRWHDVRWYELDLHPDDDGPPPGG